MILVQETTNWSTNTPNHVYFLTDNMSKMYGYSVDGIQDPFYFKNPISFDTRGRTFNTLSKVKDDVVSAVEVKGSKGDIYYVTNESNKWSCTCHSFKFRGQCKHIEEIKNAA